MALLNSHINTYNAALNILKEKGYTLNVVPLDGKPWYEWCWIAESKEIRLVGKNPVELLGLAGVREYFHDANIEWEYWWRKPSHEDLVRKLMPKDFFRTIG